ncbi:MAG: LysR family transcriptional regulator [Steroidobacteraceae bacterium]
MKLTQLRALVAIAEGHSVNAAARRLFRTQPAVSAALAELEREVGQRLFERGARGMRATEAGRILAVRATQGLRSLAASARAGGLAPTAVGRVCQQASDAQLEALAAVVEARGFTAAARQLGIAQATVHRAVATLARQLGVSLWTSSGRLVEVSAAAEGIALGYALHRSELRLARDELREAQGRLDGQLLVGALPTARASWLPRTLVRTLRDHPDAGVLVMDGPYEEQLLALRQGRLDLILGALREPALGVDIQQETVFEDTLSIVVRAGHPLAPGFDSAADRLSSAQLHALRWLLPPAGTPARRCFQAFMRGRDLAERARVVECNSFLTIRAMLLETDYAAIVPTSQVASDEVRSGLKIMGPPLRGSKHPAGWTVRTGFRPTRLQQAFLAIAREEAGR